MKEFKEWALIELFGHQRIAGMISEQQLGGSAFVRVDVPASGDNKPFTKLFGPGAIYAITITDEFTATAAAKVYKVAPMDQWSIKDIMKSIEAVTMDRYEQDFDNYPIEDEISAADEKSERLFNFEN